MLAILFVLLRPAPAAACLPADDQDVGESTYAASSLRDFEQATAVFVGDLIETTSLPNNETRYTFEVLTIWKGPRVGTIQVRGPTIPSCDTLSVIWPGLNLVYAYGREYDLDLTGGSPTLSLLFQGNEYSERVQAFGSGLKTTAYYAHQRSWTIMHGLVFLIGLMAWGITWPGWRPGVSHRPVQGLYFLALGW